MDRVAVLAAFDEQLRRNPRGDLDGGGIEREGGIVRVVRGGWAGVLWSELDERTVDGAITAQIERFAGFEGGWEWKHYSYDSPADLPERLRAAGFRSEPSEALMLAQIDDLTLDARPPEGVELVAVRERESVRALLALQAEVFGSAREGMEAELLAALAASPPAGAAVMAIAQGRPVAGGRVEFNLGSGFAGLWGGATHREWRRRGIFKALVAHRARLAAERGYRWLQVDASEQSRPILQRLGFVEVAKTTPFLYRP